MTSRRSLSALVLAAGKGTRMHSNKPKVLHTLLGESMLWYVLEAVRPLVGDGLRTIIGHRADMIRDLFPAENFVHQDQQLGTGHAVLCGWPDVLESGAEWCLVVNGDTPMIDGDVLRNFCETLVQGKCDLGFITLTLADPQSYGRVLRDTSGIVKGIVEAKDFDEKLHGSPTGEVNAGVYLLRVATMGPLLSRISADNRQQEYYLTDLVDLAVADGLQVKTMDAQDAPAFMGVNSPLELAASEDAQRHRIVQRLLQAGVTIHNPCAARIGPRVIVEAGAELFGPCEIYGSSHVAKGAVVESNTWINNSRIGSRSVVRCFSHFEGATLHEDCVAGPFARLRPDAVLEDQSRVGNFVEMKKATLGRKAKAGHLSYLGDAVVGSGANIGAGTITCNYDGKRKHITEIGPGAFIGSNTALVAPVKVGANSLIGAGSVITKDVPDDSLAVARGKQQCYSRKSKD